MTDELVRVWIHKDLVSEFLLWKEKIELKTGKKINGGTPVVSKMFAEVMKNKRLGIMNFHAETYYDAKDKLTVYNIYYKENSNNNPSVKVELNKVKGTNKNDIFFLP